MSADAPARYARAVTALAAAASTREETYSPAVKSLLEELPAELKLPFVARTNTSERRPEGGADGLDAARALEDSFSAEELGLRGPRA